MKIVGLLLVWAVCVATATGCSSEPSCQAICEEVNSCAVSQRPTDTDCAEYCNDVAELHQRASAMSGAQCEGQFQEHLSCWQKNSIFMCMPSFKSCDSTAKAWASCVSKYCTAHEEDSRCAEGGPALEAF